MAAKDNLELTRLETEIKAAKQPVQTLLREYNEFREKLGLFKVEWKD
jgi:hypothetical protein